MCTSLTLTAGDFNNWQIFFVCVASHYKMVQLNNWGKYSAVQNHSSLFYFLFPSLTDLPYSTGRITKSGILNHLYSFYRSHNVCVLIMFLNDIQKIMRPSEGLWLHSHMTSQDKTQLSKVFCQLKAHSPLNKIDVKQRGIRKDNCQWHRFLENEKIELGGQNRTTIFQRNRKR